MTRRLQTGFNAHTSNQVHNIHVTIYPWPQRTDKVFPITTFKLIIQGVPGKQGRPGDAGIKGGMGTYGERGDAGLAGEAGKRVSPVCFSISISEFLLMN